MNGQKDRRNKTKKMGVPHRETITSTCKVKVIGEEVTMDITQIMEVMEKETTIGLLKSLVVILIM